MPHGSTRGVKLRLDISAQVARVSLTVSIPVDLLELVAADAASPRNPADHRARRMRQQALALLLMSPEFQRR